MLASEHPLNELSDYVLDLLAPEDRRRVASHVQRCEECREALRRERQLIHEVRDSLHVATRPAALRLGQLMPAPTAIGRRTRFEAMMRPALALSILLVLFLGSLQLYRPGSFGASTVATPTTLAATATVTPTGTFEPVRQETAPSGGGLVLAVSSFPVETPVAGLLPVARN
jgi:anti-sigma factor RsiW